jgi:hypothetical protein
MTVPTSEQIIYANLIALLIRPTSWKRKSSLPRGGARLVPRNCSFIWKPEVNGSTPFSKIRGSSRRAPSRSVTPPVLCTALAILTSFHSLAGIEAPITKPFEARSGYGAAFAFARIEEALVLQGGNRFRAG